MSLSSLYLENDGAIEFTEEEEGEEQETQVDGDEDSEMPSRSNPKEMAESRPHGVGPCDSEEEQ